MDDNELVKHLTSDNGTVVLVVAREAAKRIADLRTRLAACEAALRKIVRECSGPHTEAGDIATAALKEPSRPAEAAAGEGGKMPDYQALVKRLRANLDKYPGFVNLNADAATAIETLLAEQKVLVAEVEAARAWLEMAGAEDHDNATNCAHENPPKYDDGPGECSECLAWIEWKKARAATDAAFPGGLTK